MALNNSHFKKLKEFITLQLPSGFPVRVEIPLYKVITAKVTFGNIHALDTHVEHVTTIKSDKPPSRSESINSDLAGQTKYLNDSDDALLIGDESEQGAAAAMPNKPSKSNPMCIVDEIVFKIPPHYRCTNRYLPSGIDSSIGGDDLRNSRVPAGGAVGQYDRRHYGQVIDDDDILLSLAIQQSLAMQNGGTVEPSEDQLTALDFIGHRPTNRSTTGGTQSLEEYQQRRNRYDFNPTEEDLILQRFVLA
jgi:hypothetical protein